MHFLLNDVVFNLSAADLSVEAIGGRFHAVSFEFVEQLGRELYAEHPILQRTQPGRAMRLAALIKAKAPEVNGALFVAPSLGCGKAQVGVRYASLDIAVMAGLHARQAAGRLTPLIADREVWRRLAA